MVEQQPVSETTRSLRTAPRWVKWALGVSLCVNLIIIGVVAGATARHHRGGGSDLGAMTMRHALRGMDEERREAAKAAIASNVQAMKAARIEGARARERLANVVAAQPFDAAAAEAVFDDILAAQQARRVLLHENFVSILSVMSEDERADAARRLKKWNRWHKR